MDIGTGCKSTAVCRLRLALCAMCRVKLGPLTQPVSRFGVHLMSSALRTVTLYFPYRCPSLTNSMRSTPQEA